jgi:hypothetical protein
VTLRLAVVLATALATLPTPSLLFADNGRVRAANQLELFYDTDLKESVVDNRLDVEITYDRFAAGLVFLAHTPSNSQLLDPNDFGVRQEGIRKRWVSASIDPLELRVGDCYATYGNGIVLRVFEDQSVDFDNVLDGLAVTAGLDRFTIEGIAGTNSLGEERAIVKGLSGRFETDSGWLFAVNGAIVDSVEGTTPMPGRDEIGGAQINGYLPGGIDIAAEYAIRHYRPERVGRSSPDDGHATYLGASGTFGSMTFFVEAKEILRFDHAYTTPPTVARQHTSTLLNRGSHVPNIRFDDERGYQAEILWSPLAGIDLTANYSESEARHATLPAWEAFGQIDVEALGGHWILYAAETEEKIREGEDRTFFERITFGGDAIRQLSDRWTAELLFETQGIQQQDLARAAFEFPDDFRDNLASLTLSFSPRHTWSATIEWTDSPFERKDSWVWIEWNIRLGVIGQLALAGGSLRGGQVCSGGVCKLVDPFEGGRLELLTNF